MCESSCYVLLFMVFCGIPYKFFNFWERFIYINFTVPYGYNRVCVVTDFSLRVFGY